MLRPSHLTRSLLVLSLAFVRCTRGEGSESPPTATAMGGLGGAEGGDAAMPSGASGVGMSGAGGGGPGVAGATASGGSSAGAHETSAGAGTCEPEPTQLLPWPGPELVQTLDTPAQFSSDLSGLTFDAEAGVLWAANNLTNRLFRLVPEGAGFVPDTANGWSAGKRLRYPSGQGAPDAEGVTLGKSASDGVYVCAEHDAAAASTSRLSVLRYDVFAAGDTLTATHEWNLTALLPPAEANTGLEAISWLPDDYLVERGFIDDEQRPYVPADHPGHGSGLFVVGVEATGKLYVLALSHADSSARLLATVATPNPGVMGLELDRDAGQLWFSCDDGCGNKSGILDIDTRPGSPTRGRFVNVRQFQRPSRLPDSNNEGIAIGPAADCQGGYKPFFWTDDADADGYSLRRGAIPCAACF